METNNRHILLPTDFSDNAWSAIVYALKLYALESCTFYILHSAHSSLSSISDKYSRVYEEVKENANTNLLELKTLAETANANANHDFEIILSTESLYRAIDTTVKKYNIDLVVMGTKGATGAQEFLFGSNTVKMISKMRSCPILIIPEDYDFVTPKQIAFPSDFNRFYGATDLDALKDLASLYNSKIRVVHIETKEELTEVQEHNITTLESYFGEFEHSLHWVPDYSKKANDIKGFIAELEIDMLAMVNYKHSFIEKIFNEPVIKKIGFNPTIPFLVIPG
ncbi:universal stress protein [Algibacter luteus]|uniref:universal stress protein n=1 Tax=Algibacter luteus TaxID=1178825 RepID=UPI00259431E8|nr:universal stress protein [Algibacter luteus]WJJ95758.1 universal stress protein [Algibacter luteus]